MDDHETLRTLVAEAGTPSGRRVLLRRLGFTPCHDPVPHDAWPAYGLGHADHDGTLLAAAVVGRSGEADALQLDLEGDAGIAGIHSHARAVRARNTARLHLFLFVRPGKNGHGSTLTLAVFGLDGSLRHLTLEPARPRESDLDALAEMLPPDGEGGLPLMLRYVRALDRSRVTRRFFRDFRSHRAGISAAWAGLPADHQDRDPLALLFLSRLTFLYFLQRRGALAGDTDFLPALLGCWSPRDDHTFYRARLRPLFFGALNRRPHDRDASARALGNLPYLNGGLFEEGAMERRHPGLDLPDDAVRGAVEDLLERYRFTAREESDGAGYGVDPEVLGRVFEGLMARGDRGDTGSFYTPSPVVHRVVREALATYVGGACPGVDAEAVVDGSGGLEGGKRAAVRRRLERLRVLDPACGSGAFLLGALHHLARATAGVSGADAGAIRREIVATSLHGVDLLDDAALLCSLRLWLALSADTDEVRPLPNLDRRIRQGDALVDPLDLGGAGMAAGGAGGGAGGAFHPLRDPETRRALRAVAPASRAYLESSPEERGRLREELARSEAALARHWARALARSEAESLRRLRAMAGDRDLFGERPDSARRAEAALRAGERRVEEIREIEAKLDDRGSLPFFSFGVHFSEASEGFDLVLSNPPWIRSHRWPERLRGAVARRFEVCRDRGWVAGAELTGAPAGVGAQTDLSLLFLERAVRLLAPGGVLAMVLPAKALRSLYGAAARRILLRDLELCLVEDHALHHRSIFEADAFASVIIARKPVLRGGRDGPGATSPAARARLVRKDGELGFDLRPEVLPLFPDDRDSPWILAPADALAGFRAMQEAGPPLGRHAGLRVRRGVMTGANDVLVLRDARPRLGGLCEIEAEGHGRRPSGNGGARFRAVVETAAVRPLVRGADISAFRYRTESYVLWCHDDDGAAVEPGRRTLRYLERHRKALEGRSGWRPGMPLGSIFRLAPEGLGARVAWHDLSDTLKAVALPGRVPFDGGRRELVALNTVYFLPTASDDEAVLLAGLLNSTPARCFARSIAERAKDARFRFFAWTVSCLPLPPDWRTHPAALDLLRLSRRAHEAGGMADDDRCRLDRAAAALYRLSPGQAAAIAAFDAWLSGS